MKSMKITRDQIKAKLAEYLAKEGASIEDFEQALTIAGTADLQKRAELEKKAIKTPDAIKGGYGLVKDIGALLGTGSMIGGGLLGIGGYAGYKGLQDSNKKINDKLIEQQQYEDAIVSLQAAMQKRQMGGM